MNKCLIWCLLGFILLVSAPRSQAQTVGETEKAIVALEQQWLQSQRANNPDLAAPLLADKFVCTLSDGKVYRKTEFLTVSRKDKWSGAEYDDLKVTVFGDTAIATGGQKFKGTDASGKLVDSNERWTDTWVKMPNGKWQCVASHSSPITM